MNLPQLIVDDEGHGSLFVTEQPTDILQYANLVQDWISCLVDLYSELRVQHLLNHMSTAAIDAPTTGPMQ